jgi:hypothetical protein
LSKITNRKGLSENLPQLAGAEFGWVLDERKLYIGNGEIVDGAPVVGNTEILTQFSDILELAGSYTYKGSAAGYVVTTGENDTDVTRTLQAKFDDMVSVKDFGAKGNGVTDDTDAINRALFELFCREVNTEVRRSLFFPAGNYIVTGKIKIPPHAKLYGEGLTSSIISFVKSPDIAVSTLTVGEQYAISVVGTTDFTTVGASNNDVNTVFTATGTAAGTGLARLYTTSAVVETADSLQQTGANLGNNSATLPTGIEMVSMAIYSTELNSLLLLDSVSNSGFHYLGLHGPKQAGDLSAATNPTSAVSIGTSVATTRDVTISKLDTSGTTYGLRAEGDVKGVVLENSGLDLHYQGVVVTNPVITAPNIVIGTTYKIVTIGTTPTDYTAIGADFNRVGVIFTATASAPAGNGTVIDMNDAGPTGVVVSRNIFENIAREGIHFENVLFNSSGYNVFYDVGNAFGGNATPTSPVIRLDTDQCISVGDLFERDDESVQPRVLLGANGGIYIDGAHSIHLGSFERQVGIEASLPAGATNMNIFEIVYDENTINSYRIDYNIRRGNNGTRMGSIQVSNIATGIASVIYIDEYSEAGAGPGAGADLEVVNLQKGTPGNYNYTSSALQFTSTAVTDAIINYSVVRLD